MSSCTDRLLNLSSRFFLSCGLLLRSPLDFLMFSDGLEDWVSWLEEPPTSAAMVDEKPEFDKSSEQFLGETRYDGRNEGVMCRVHRGGEFLRKNEN